MSLISKYINDYQNKNIYLSIAEDHHVHIFYDEESKKYCYIFDSGIHYVSHRDPGYLGYIQRPDINNCSDTASSKYDGLV